MLAVDRVTPGLRHSPTFVYQGLDTGPAGSGVKRELCTKEVFSARKVRSKNPYTERLGVLRSNILYCAGTVQVQPQHLNNNE
jgi:hypothetical protein